MAEKNYFCFIKSLGSMNLSKLASISSIYYEETNLDFLRPLPQMFSCGIQLLCIRGEALVSTGAQRFSLKPMSELIFWGGSIMQVLDSSADFKVRLLLYPQSLFLKVTVSLDTTYFNYMREFPYFEHGKDGRMESWKSVNLWMDMAEMLFSGRPGSFTERLSENYLQSMLMWIFSSIPEQYISTTESYTRKQMLFHRFMHLIHEYALKEHQVSFYAEKLCISARYLCVITSLYSQGKTPKQLIDEQLSAEVMVQLNNMDLSLSEIAGICSFPDSSYLSRFFKKIMGISPNEYRLKRISGSEL